MCVHSPPSLHGWLLQATLGSEREGERFLPRGINRAGHALPRVGPVPLPRGGGGNCTLMVGGWGGVWGGEGAGLMAGHTSLGSTSSV